MKLLSTSLMCAGLGSLMSFNAIASELQNELVNVGNDGVCYISALSNNKLDNCNKLLAFELTELTPEQRRDVTEQYLGLGFDSKYIFVTNFGNRKKENIFTVESYDSNYLYQNIVPSIISTKSRVRRSAPMMRSASPLESEEYVDGKYVRTLHKIINTGAGQSELVYKIAMYSKSPVYDRGSRRKYVDITLNEGSGINFNTLGSGYYYTHRDGKYSSFYGEKRSWSPKRHFEFFEMNEYLDSFNAKVSLNNSGVTQGRVSINDWTPRRQDQTDMEITKTTETKFSFGLKKIPKLPIESIDFSHKQEIKIKSSKVVELKTEVDDQSYDISYTNQRVGSAAGYYMPCQFVTRSSGCWYAYANAGENPYDLSGLEQAYINGFRPDFYTQVTAEGDAKGVTGIHVRATITGLSLLGHNRWAAGRLYYSGHAADGVAFNKYDHVDTFNVSVNWSHPAFLGASTVNLSPVYISEDEAKCITADEQMALSLKACQADDARQAFVYAPNTQYRFAANPAFCLDASQDKLSLKACETYPSNDQRWQWTGDADYDRDVLFTPNYDNTLSVISTNSDSELKINKVERNGSYPAEFKFYSAEAKLY